MSSTAVVKLHAKLSASGSKKWLTCSPSARLEEQFPDERSTFAAEGTFMHELFELLLLNYLQRITAQEFEDRLGRLHADGFWTAELDEAVREAVAFAENVIEQARKDTPDCIVLLEQRLDFSPWVPEGFGTGDLVIVSDQCLHALDLKGGKGVPVSAIDNSQMRLYALGALHQLGHLFDARSVKTTVLQPRLGNYSSEELTVDELTRWADDYVRPRATLAWDGAGEFVAGEHCTSGFCKARFTCAARAQHNLALAKREFTPPELLTVDQIAAILPRADEAIAWLQDVKTYALSQAETGHTVPGFKLVEGRANRKYVDHDQVAAKLIAAGIPAEVIYERSLLGITAMEKALGKKVFAELISDLVVKPQGKPTLVPDSDKRPALNSVASAAADFS